MTKRSGREKTTQRWYLYSVRMGEVDAGGAVNIGLEVIGDRLAKIQRMIHGIARDRLTQLLGQFPAVALLGPQQVAKTTLALSLTKEAQNSPLYLDLELPSHRAKLADPELYLSGYEDRLVNLDEIHRIPEIFKLCVV